MKHFIQAIDIKNFKTAKHIKINCSRINLIIGKPNVGKSNILEAISLLGGNYSQNENKYLSDFIRYENFEDLFYDQETSNPIEISTNLGIASIRYQFDNSYNFIMGPDKEIVDVFKMERSIREIRNDFINYTKTYKHQEARLNPYYKVIYSKNNTELEAATYISPVKKYFFKKPEIFNSKYHFFLLPPDGKNLYTIVQRNKKLFREISNFFKEYKLHFVLKKSEAKFEIQKNISGVVLSYPYYNIADTLQRIIFYIMAIESNKDSVLLFEEPETHSFPPYTKLLAEKIVACKHNQFFLTTHSPFILNTIIENADLNDVSIFIASYERYQTKLEKLSEKEIRNLLNYGSDIFFNIG